MEVVYLGSYLRKHSWRKQAVRLEREAMNREYRSLLWAIGAQFQCDFQGTMCAVEISKLQPLGQTCTSSVCILPALGGTTPAVQLCKPWRSVQMFSFSLLSPLLLVPASSASGCTLLMHRTCANCQLYIGCSSIGNFWAPRLESQSGFWGLRK